MAQPALATIECSAAPAIGQTRLFMNNEWVDPLDGTCFNTLNPATGEVIASVAQGGAADIDRAVKAARRALESPPYSTMDAVDRGRLLLRLADLVEAHAQELAQLESLNTGKTIADS
jgi:aldehyde dehydrogenase (NAD+)